MFTGIVEACVPIRSLAVAGEGGAGARLRLPVPDTEWATAPGDSVAVSGCCLTVAGYAEPGSDAVAREPVPGADLVFDLSAETLARTWLGTPDAASRWVNLERSLQLGDRLGGHLVSGHVDGGGHVVAIEDAGDGGQLIRFSVDAGLERYLIEKGSVTLDGISLTVVAPQGRAFAVAVIPETLAVTSLGRAKVGEAVNVEADLIGKWVEKLVPAAMRPRL